MNAPAQDAKLEWALRLIGDGFYIIPLETLKKSPRAGVSWKAIKTNNPSCVREWFRETPEMNYGVVCDDEHVIIDVDNGRHSKTGVVKEGERYFRAAEDEDAGFPAESALDSTFKVRTPKGGYHLYFRCKRPYKISTGQIMADVDVRSRDGYVVGPGCATGDYLEENTVAGDYTVVNSAAIAEVPSWLEARLEKSGLSQDRKNDGPKVVAPLDLPENIDSAKRMLTTQAPAIEGRGGDAHTFRTACQVRDFGVSEETCLELMLAWNEHCEPPWELDELASKVHNAYSYASSPVGTKADLMAGIGVQIVGSQSKPGPGSFEEASSPEDGLKRVSSLILTGDEFLAREIEVDSLIPEWIPAFGITAVLAKRGGGKSALMVDMSLRVASDMPWNGITTAQGWASVYLCGEDDVGLQRQMAAWRIVNKTFPDADRLFVAPAVPNLMDGNELKLWASAIKARLKGRRAVVFLDTWQRATRNASQNEDREMQVAIYHAEQLARTLNGCAVIAFHSPKLVEETITGSMVQENSTVAILVVKKVKNGNGLRTVKVERIKGRGEGNSVEFRLPEVRLGLRDKSGAELTGVIAEFTQDAMTMAQRDKQAVLALEADRERWAAIIRGLIERTGSCLTTNAFLNVLKNSGDSLGDTSRPSDEVFRERLRIMFGKPFLFPDGKVLTYVKANARKFEFRLSKNDASDEACFPDGFSTSTLENLKTEAFPGNPPG